MVVKTKTEEKDTVVSLEDVEMKLLSYVQNLEDKVLDLVGNQGHNLDDSLGEMRQVISRLGQQLSQNAQSMSKLSKEVDDLRRAVKYVQDYVKAQNTHASTSRF